jgi:hypothetical protein
MSGHIAFTRGVALLAGIALTTACATTPNPIAQDVRDGFYVDGAEVTWLVDEADARAADEEYQAGKSDLITRLDSAVEREFASSPSGAEAVSFQIGVTRYTRVGAAMGNIIGGSNTVTADVTVVRKSDGSTIGVYEGVSGTYASNQGILGAIAQAAVQPDIVGIMSNTFATNLRTRFNSK